MAKDIFRQDVIPEMTEPVVDVLMDAYNDPYRRFTMTDLYEILERTMERTKNTCSFGSRYFCFCLQNDIDDFANRLV